MSDLSVMFEGRDNVTVAAVDGALTAETADAFKEQLDGWLAQQDGPPRVVLDLSGVNVMDSSGLGSILGVWQQVSDRAGTLLLAALQQKPRLLFDITRANRAFDIYESVEDAIRAEV